MNNNKYYDLLYVLAIFNSKLLSWYQVTGSSIALRDDYPKLSLTEIGISTIFLLPVNFATLDIIFILLT